MLFTICIPTYNRAYCINRPLDSLLAQTFRDFEVLVVDDGSTDNTENVVLDYMDKEIDIKYIKKPNGGKHSALNLGIKHASGELFIILDSDDEFVPETLNQLADKWGQDGDRPDICGIMARCSSNGEIIGKPFPPYVKEMSYVQFHYGKGAGQYGDCCECLRTDILKKYRWPEIEGTKFVPENYITDQIGLHYKLLLDDVLIKKVYYVTDGITKNVQTYQKMNYLGYLYNAVSKIELIMPNSNEISFVSKLKIWMRYWRFVDYDVACKGARCKQISLLGRLSQVLYFIKKKQK